MQALLYAAAARLTSKGKGSRQRRQRLPLYNAPLINPSARRLRRSARVLLREGRRSGARVHRRPGRRAARRLRGRAALRRGPGGHGARRVGRGRGRAVRAAVDREPAVRVGAAGDRKPEVPTAGVARGALRRRSPRGGAVGRARRHRRGRARRGTCQCGNQPVRQAGLEVLFTIVAASTQCESAWRPRTRRLRLTHPNF